MTVTAALLLSAPALATTDIPIPGKVAIVKPGKLGKFVAKISTELVLPSPGATDDPTVGGALVHFFERTAPRAGRVTFQLDHSGWKGLGNPAGSKGYKYTGKDDTADPNSACKLVLLKQKVVKALCYGPAVTLQPPFAGSEGILLDMPAGTAVTQYCAEFGGT